MADTVELDIRPVPPPQKHPTIFRTFDGLGAGTAMILVNDHDPRPLYYELTHERPGTFQWEYIEQGPVTWRVRITKAA